MREQAFIGMDHSRAGGGKANYEFGIAIFAQLDETFSDLSRLAAISRIEGRLAAAGLPLIELNFTARATQDLDCAGADAAPQLIHQAGDKQTHFYWRLPIFNFRFFPGF